MTAPGWYNAEGDPPGTTRYWDGTQWVGDPVVTPVGPTGAGGAMTGRREIASAGARIGARLIDFVIIAILTLAVMWSTIRSIIDDIDALGPFATSDQQQRIIEDAITGSSGRLLLAVVLGFAWEWLWVAFTGGTPGKHMIGLRVADAGTEAVPPAMPKAALRAANRLLPVLGAASAGASNLASLILVLVGLVSLVFLFTDSRRRTVMDRVGGTIVVKK